MDRLVTFWQRYSVTAISLYAIGMGMFWALGRLNLLGVPMPDPGAYITVGLLGSAVMSLFAYSERRVRLLEEALAEQKRHIRRLEKQLHDRGEGDEE